VGVYYEGGAVDASRAARPRVVRHGLVSRRSTFAYQPG
jgi:hypothetical protein